MSGDTTVPRLLTVRELEARTGLAGWRWYALFARGEGPPHFRVGKVIQVREAALARWIAEREAQCQQAEKA